MLPSTGPPARTETSSAAVPDPGVAASTLGVSAAIAATSAPAVEATVLGSSMASFGRALELVNPVTLPDLPAAAPHAVKLALREGVSEVRIRLWPPELGSILVRLRINGAEVSARMETERTDVRGLLASMQSDLGRGMQEAGLKLTRLEVGPVQPNESLRAWETAIPVGAASMAGGGGTIDRPGPGAAAGHLGQSNGFSHGDSGPRGEHAAGGRGGNGREEAGLASEDRSKSGEAGLGTRSRRPNAAIDAWA